MKAFNHFINLIHETDDGIVKYFNQQADIAHEKEFKLIWFIISLAGLIYALARCVIGFALVCIFLSIVAWPVLWLIEHFFMKPQQ